MYDNYNYPPGADTPDAPWNEVTMSDITVDAEVTVLLKNNNISVETNNYCVDVCEEDGYQSIELNDGYSEIEKYYQIQHKSIPELLNELSKYIKEELAKGDISASRRQELEAMLEDCTGWEITDVEIEDYYIAT